jgi:4,5-dihydroxyphthalate decarboxylase
MNPEIRIAVGKYDHVADVVDGSVRIAGVDAHFLSLGFENIVHRFLRHREWDVSEMSLGAYVRMVSAGDESLIALPIFTSRVFRQSAFFVPTDSDVRSLGELTGKRIGIPTWYQTACIFARGILLDEFNIATSANQWVQAGVTSTTRRDSFPVDLGTDVSYEICQDDTLEGLLDSGKVDAVISARSPRGVGRTVRTVLSNPAVDAADYFQRTGIFPIMHLLVMRRDIYEKYPWIAGNLLEAFEESKRRSLVRLTDPMLSYIAVPGAQDIHGRLLGTQGLNIWPYGIRQNAVTLRAFLRFCQEQHVLAGPIESIDALFTPSALEPIEP